MKLTYRISKRLQEELTAIGQDARAVQTTAIPDIDVADIISTHRLLEVSPCGEPTLNLTKRTQNEIRVKTVIHGSFGNLKRHIYHTSDRWGDIAEFDFLIQTPDDLKEALRIISLKEAHAKAEANLLTECELQAFNQLHNLACQQQAGAQLQQGGNL